MRPKAALAVVTFHSLEDRIVKLFLAARSGRGETQSRRLPGEPMPLPPTFSSTGASPSTPPPAEIAANPRARSAKLRVATRTQAAARGSTTLWRLAELAGAGAGRRG